MTLEELLAAQDWEAINTYLSSKSKDGIEDAANEYKNDREIRDEQVGKRLTKKTIQNKDLEVNKIPVPLQRKIVQFSSAFLFGEPISLINNDFEEDEINAINDAVIDTRLDGAMLKCCELCKAYTKAGLLFRVAKNSVGETAIKVKVLNPEEDTFEPGFNDFGDMVLFMYATSYTNEEEKTVERFYYYDQKKYYIVDKIQDNYELIESKPHQFDRIPAVYVDQEFPEWEYVKPLIDRYEMQLSKLADINDYFASPVWKVNGKLDKVPEKDDTGSVYKLDSVMTDDGKVIPSDLSVVAWEQSTASIELELNTLKELIYSICCLPDISFEKLQGIGNIAGVSLKLMFLDPEIKKKFDSIIFGTFAERTMNVLLSGLANVTKDLNTAALQKKYQVQFNSIVPDNIEELVGILSEATGGKAIMSVETAVGLNPMVENPKEELTKIQADETDDLGNTVV